MKLETCLKIGIECGLKTVEEAICNVKFHATNIFTYQEIGSELFELLNNVKAVELETGFNGKSSCADVLEYLQKENKNGEMG